MIALTTAGQEPIAPASPAPLTPKGLVLQGTLWVSNTKDGPSAGIGMVTAMISTLTGTPVRRDVAMTVEVTLRGRVLPIGGLKEKLLAALRGGIRTVLIPAENEKDLAEIPASVKDGLEIVPVSHVDEVLSRALVEPLEAIEWTDADEHAAEPPLHAPASDTGAAIRH